MTIANKFNDLGERREVRGKRGEWRVEREEGNTATIAAGFSFRVNSP